MTIKDQVKDNLKELLQEEKQMQVPLATISRRLNTSVATVHRVVKEMEKENMVKIVASQIRTEPNKIIYLGDPRHEVPKQMPKENIEDIVENLLDHLEIKQTELNKIRDRLNNYEKDIIKTVELPQGIQAIYKKKGGV